MRFWKKLLLFLLGGGAYVGLEWLWRRRSHASMFFAGGLCFLLSGVIRKLRCPWFWKGILGALGITLVELTFGCLWNRTYGVWDYRRLPLNFRGQICLGYSALWAPLSLVAMALYGAAARLLENRKELC